MFPFAPMPLLDDFIVQYNIGQALILLFILSLPAGVVRGSGKITAIVLATFGALFVIVPALDDVSIFYALLGIALLVIGPMVYVTADQ